MNNLLELCKIFHCHINDLVNDRMIDIDSLDEDVKMKVVKLKKEQQSKMKGLSKAIAILAKIGKIICMVCIPIVIASMIILGIVISKVRITDNQFIWNDKDIIKVTEVDHKLSLTINNKVIADITNEYDVMKIKDVLQHNSTLIIFGYVETGLAFLIVCFILISIMLQSLERLFCNINKGDTPFTLENVGYIKKMAYLMIAITILPNVIGILFETILKMDLNVGLEMFSLVEILFLFSIAYIFQYGYEIQLDSKGKMYGEENE